ncbi:hypothetical protein QBC45DRAFT_394458 [Copromyces sp. CBS 386.78]|nr:hypothetical protein QBC45DRAFT_394458 [Copromyces sp. CBS 386.78]
MAKQLERNLAKEERRKKRDMDAKRSERRLREKKAERKQQERMARREQEKKLKRRAANGGQFRTKVTVKIFTDSAGALLMLGGQLPITTPGLRTSAMAAIEQSMEELERHFINHASRVLGSHGQARRRLYNRADNAARHVRGWAANGVDDWHRGCEFPVSRPKEYFAGLNGELPECDEPAVSLLVEHKPLSG